MSDTSSSKVCSREMDLTSSCGVTRREVLTPGPVSEQLSPISPNDSRRRCGGTRARSPTVVTPRSRSCSRRAGPTPGSRSTGRGARNSASLPGGTTVKPPGLSIVGGHLGHQLVGGQPDGDAQLELVGHPLLDEPGRLHRRAEQPLGAGEVDVGLVEAHLLHQRRVLVQHGHETAGILVVELMMPGEIHPMGAETPGGAERHGRMHAVPPGHVVGGGHHPPLAAPDDDRLAPQRRVPVLLDRGEEGVEVEMGDDPVSGPRPDDVVPRIHSHSIAKHMFGYKGGCACWVRGQVASTML